MNEKITYWKKWLSELSPEDKKAVMLIFATSGQTIERRGYYGGPAPTFDSPSAAQSDSCPLCKRAY